MGGKTVRKRQHDEPDRLVMHCQWHKNRSVVGNATMPERRRYAAAAARGLEIQGDGYGA